MLPSELIDFTSSMYLDDKTAMVSGQPDQLWPPAALTRWLNDAQRILCRRAWVLSSCNNVDLGIAPTADNDALTKLVLVVGSRAVPFPSNKILQVQTARLDDTQVDLIKTTYADIHPTPMVWFNEEFWDINNPYTEEPGRPQWFASDFATRTFAVRPIPDGSSSLNVLLRVVHMPLYDMTSDDVHGIEVPEEYHEDLALYAAGRALMNPNIDAGKEGRTAGKEFLAEFNAKVLMAREDRQRREQAPVRFRFGKWAHDHRT